MVNVLSNSAVATWHTHSPLTLHDCSPSLSLWMRRLLLVAQCPGYSPLSPSLLLDVWREGEGGRGGRDDWKNMDVCEEWEGEGVRSEGEGGCCEKI